MFIDAQSPDSPPLLPSNSQNPKSAPAASPSLCDCASMRHHLDSFSCRASHSSYGPACCQPSSYSGPSLLHTHPGETQQGLPTCQCTHSWLWSLLLAPPLPLHVCLQLVPASVCTTGSGHHHHCLPWSLDARPEALLRAPTALSVMQDPRQLWPRTTQSSILLNPGA